MDGTALPGNLEFGRNFGRAGESLAWPDVSAMTRGSLEPVHSPNSPYHFRIAELSFTTRTASRSRCDTRAYFRSGSDG